MKVILEQSTGSDLSLYRAICSQLHDTYFVLDGHEHQFYTESNWQQADRSFAELLHMIRHIVLNLLRGAKSQFRKDTSLKGLQKKAGWGEKTLSTILMQEF